MLEGGAATIGAALLGAMLGGGLDAFSGFRARRRETKNCFTAIAVEVDAICGLIRSQRYIENFAESLEDLKSGQATSVSFSVDVNNHYFSVFESLCPRLGQLAPEDSIRIVRFYAYCKALIDSTRPGGIGAQDIGGPEGVAMYQEKLALVKAILGLGDGIVQSAKIPIVPERLQ